MECPIKEEPPKMQASHELALNLIRFAPRSIPMFPTQPMLP